LTGNGYQEKNYLQKWIGIELNDWKNIQWADTLESLNPEVLSLWK
jgi:hypothetical protein